MTIFGFNTDIKFGDTVYHVQSEERRHDSLLQTQVFVRGRCIGKHSSSYSYTADSALDESRAHELLKAQHRAIVEAVRAGKIEEVLSQQPAFVAPELASGAHLPVAHVEHRPNPATIVDSSEQPLELKFLNPESVLRDNAVSFRFSVADAGVAVAGAKVVCRLQVALADGREAPPIYSQALTSADGCADISVAVDEPSLHQASLLVQASHNGKLATRKYRLRGK